MTQRILSKITRLFSRRSGGIRQRLLIWGLTLLGIALIVNTLAVSIYARRLIRRDAAQLQSEIASRVALEIEEFIHRKVERLIDFSASASLYEIGGREQRLLILLLLKNDRAFTEAAVLDESGMEVLKVSERRVYFPEELVDQSDAEKYQKATKGANYISEVYTSDKAEPYVSLAIPLKITPQEIIGVISVEANLRILWEVIGEIEFGRAGYAYLVDGRGNLIAHRDPSLVLKRTNLGQISEIQEFLRNPTEVDPTPGSENIGIAGKPVLSTFAPVQSLGWAVVLEEPLDLALAGVRQVERYALLLLGIGLVGGALIIVWVSNRITGPILELHRGAEDIGRGNLTHRVEIKSGDEIEKLAHEFNKMAGGLQASYATLEENVEQRTKELAALYDVAATVNQSLELDKLSQEVIKKISGIFHFDATRIFLFNPQKDELRLRASIETRPEFFTGVRVFRRGQGVVGNVAETMQPLVFEDILTDPRYLELSHTRSLRKSSFSFFAAFPIKAKEKCLGTIIFVGQNPRQLTTEERRLLTSMVDQIGIAVENATLFEETVARSLELSALYDVAAAVNQSLEPDLILREVIQKILEATHFDAGRIFLLSPDGELRLKTYVGLSPEFASETSFYPTRNRITSKVFEAGKPVFFEDIQTNPEYSSLTKKGKTREAGFRAFISIPLKTKEKIAGVMNFLSRKPHDFSAKDIALFTSMANQIGVALENAALFEQVKTRSRQLAALNTITATVNRSLEPDVVLKESIEKVCELLGFDAGWIYVLDPTAQWLHLRAYKGLKDEDVRPMYRREIGTGSMGKVVKSGEPSVYEDIQEDASYLQVTAGRKAQSLGFRTLCNFPIKSKQRTLGVLNLANYSRRRFAPEELELIGSIATEIGVGVDNARLFEETIKWAKQLSALYNVTATVNQSLELEGVLQEVIEKITGIFHFNTMRIFVFNPQMDELHLRASFPLDRDDISNVRIFRRGEGVVGRVADSGKAMIFEDAPNDPEYLAFSKTKTTQKGGFSFFAAFPIRARKRSIGAIMCNSKASLRLKLDEVQLIESMADQIGVAVENADLFYEAKRKTLELQKANIELVEASRAKADFLAAMSHELRTPLNVIIGNADLIRDGMFGDLTEKQKIALEKILHYSETLLKLINDVLTLTKMTAQKTSLNVSTFDVGEIIAHAQSYVEQLNRDGRLKVLWHVEPGLPPMTTDALKLEEILQNLIGNAFKFTPKGRIEVRVQDLGGNGRIEFSVADTGIGIPNHELDKIFEQFHQLGEAHTGSYSGVGLGLSIVKRYVEMMQGTIRVESQPGKGSTFTFELPYSI